MPQLRLRHVLVQPVFVLDHGDSLEDVEHPVIMIPAAEWTTYSAERFPREVAEWQARIDTQAEALHPPIRRTEGDERGNVIITAEELREDLKR